MSATIKVTLLFVLIGSIYCAKEKVKPTLTYKHEQGEIYVFDKLISERSMTLINSYVRMNSSYQYNYPDPYEAGKNTRHEGNLHWRSSVPPNLMIKTKVWGAIRKAYQRLPEHLTHGKRYLPYQVYGTMLMRGEYTTSFKGDVDHPDSIFVRIFITDAWKRNDYSDQTFYDSDDEIIASIHPKPARIVMWTGSLETLLRPPSMGQVRSEYSLILKLNPDEELFQKACDDFVKAKEEQKRHRNSPLPFTNVSLEKYGLETFNVSEKLLGKYFDKAGNAIGFFDNILPKEMLDALRSFLTKYETGYGVNSYDVASAETHDNVALLATFNPDIVLNTPYFTAIRRVTEYLSNTTGWTPYDVSCNLIQHTHHTRIHLDCTHGEFEYTLLLYLNPDWTENLYGETTFFEINPSSIQDGDIGSSPDEEYDFIASAIPKFGRIACFRNLIPHSGRPPASSFLAARYTFPVKLAESYRQSLATMLMESLDNKSDDMPDDPLYAELKNANFQPFLKEDKQAWLEQHLSFMRKAKSDGDVVDRDRIASALFQKRQKPSP